MVMHPVPIVHRWSAGKASEAWLFAAPEGGPLRESNWSVRSAGLKLPLLLDARGSESTIGVIRRRRCGWVLALTRR